MNVLRQLASLLRSPGGPGGGGSGWGPGGPGPGPPGPNNQRKEAFKIELQPLPLQSQLKTWLIHTRHAVAAASVNPKACMQWFREAESLTATMEYLAEPGTEFEGIDSKLATAIMGLTHKSTHPEHSRLIPQIHFAADKANREGVPIRGRQLIFIVLQLYRTDERHRAFMDYQDLMRVQYRPTDREPLREFLMRWENCIYQQKIPLTELQALPILMAQVQRDSLVSQALKHYDFLDEADDPRLS